MTKISQTNWFIWIVSFVPGLGLFILNKRKLGLYVALIIFLLLVLFWFKPNIITWFIFGLAFITQMAYAVGLATIRKTINQATPNSNLAHPLPAKFADKKKSKLEIANAFSSLLGNDEHIIAGIIGLEQISSQTMLVGVTQEFLIVSPCNQTGHPSDPKRILKEDVTWVNIEIGRRNLMISFEYERGNMLTLHVQGNLREQSMLMLAEFPGTWSNEKFVDDYSSLQKENFSLSAIIISVICFSILIAVVILTTGLDQPIKRGVTYLTMSVLFYIIGWPQFISYIRRLKKEPGITSVNIIASFSVLSVLFVWSISLYTLGVITIALVNYLHHVG